MSGTKLEQAARQALGALVRAEAMYGQPNADIQTALREALAEPKKPEECANGCPQLQVCDYCQIAEQAEQEPVAWWCCAPGQDPVLLFDEPSDERYPPNYKEPLYAAPVRTKDLTDDDILEAVGIRYAEPHTKHRILKNARAVIAADREKNK